MRMWTSLRGRCHCSAHNKVANGREDPLPSENDSVGPTEDALGMGMATLLQTK